VAATRRFPIRLGPRSRPLLRLFGARDDTAWVDLGPDGMTARFGWSSGRTPLANITGWRIEGPWLWLTAIGLRRSWRAREMTFGGNHRGGVKVTFREPIRVAGLSTTALYVSVADLEGFGAALRELGIPGQDGRTGPTS
jgi:hypothetical protein